MRFFLRRLDSGAVNVRRRVSRKWSRSPAFEQLSSRELLAGDVVVPTEELAIVAPASTESDGTLVAPLPADAVTANVTVSPLWGDGGTVTTQNSENGYGQSYPPTIANFTATEEFGVWTFTGQVIDDKDVAETMVRFGGLLEGHYAIVQADGTFEISHTFPPNTTGVVTAIATDTDSLDSEPAECLVW
jgi:hypothetical protein